MIDILLYQRNHSLSFIYSIYDAGSHCMISKQGEEYPDFLHSYQVELA